jgi:hypothetical protein
MYLGVYLRWHMYVGRYVAVPRNLSLQLICSIVNFIHRLQIHPYVGHKVHLCGFRYVQGTHKGHFVAFWNM